jgi:hypothetical protein
MTSEVFVLNKRGVGIATDSAATSGFEVERRDGTIDHIPKIKNAATKLFPLTGEEGSRVAVGFYGNSAISGCPVETLVLGFAKSSAGKEHSSVKECFLAFVSYVEKTAGNGAFGGGPKASIEDFTDTLCNYALEQYFGAGKGQSLFTYERAWKQENPGKKLQSLSDWLRKEIETAKKKGTAILGWESLRTLPKDAEKSLKESIELDFTKETSAKRKLSPGEIQLLSKLALERLRRHGPWDCCLTTGIVFAGYGK